MPRAEAEEEEEGSGARPEAPAGNFQGADICALF